MAPVTVGFGFCSRQEKLYYSGALGALQQSSNRANGGLINIRRDKEFRFKVGRNGVFHEFGPDGQGDHGAVSAHHDYLGLVETSPDSRYQVWCIAFSLPEPLRD